MISAPEMPLDRPYLEGSPARCFSGAQNSPRRCGPARTRVIIKMFSELF